MAKVLNILIVAYLAVAPAMNVGALLHAVELCQYFEPAAVTASHHHCGHDHAPDNTESLSAGDCDHDHALPIESRVAPAVAPPATVDDTGIGFCCVFHPLARAFDHGRIAGQFAIPPPLPDLTGTVILQL